MPNAQSNQTSVHWPVVLFDIVSLAGNPGLLAGICKFFAQRYGDPVLDRRNKERECSPEESAGRKDVD